LQHDPATGQLKQRPGDAAVTSLPPAAPTGKYAAAEIIVAPNGRTLFVSNRGLDGGAESSVASFAIAPSSEKPVFLSSIDSTVLGMYFGFPRGLGMSQDGRFLLAAGQDNALFTTISIDSDGSLTVFKGNQQLDGVIGPTGITFIDHGENGEA
jgi:6-phosphogluconolactonase (cycloisomerase 2 family)